MAAANNSKSYCKKYNPDHFRVLFYNQALAGKNKTILSTLDHRQIENPVKAITKSELQGVIKAIYLSTCAGIVNETYVKDQLSKNTLLMILFDTSDNTAEDVLPPNCKRFVAVLGKPVAFILGHTNDKDDTGAEAKESYLDIICACPGSGRYLLEFFIQYSEINDFTAVSLSALPGVLTYYPKFGFYHRHSCRPEDVEVPSIKAQRDNIIAKRKVGMKDELLYDDDDYFEYFKALRDANFGKTQANCDGILTKEKLKKGKCDNDGYMMRRCKK